METNNVRGFTLVELMVTLAILAILLGVGVPSFAAAIRNSCMSANHNDLVSSLYRARSEAVKSSSPVTVCPRSTPTSEACGSAWANGWLVFVDDDPDDDETTASVDAGDTVVDVMAGVCGDASVSGFGSSDRTAAGVSARNYVRYTANGSTDWKNGYFVICDDRGAESARTINIVITGDIRRGRPASTGSDVPADVFGIAATCPASS